jgi:hypothetical protein
MLIFNKRSYIKNLNPYSGGYKEFCLWDTPGCTAVKSAEILALNGRPSITYQKIQLLTKEHYFISIFP